MATLREIRNQLRSVENIKKITQAMEMVAASRLRRSQLKTENACPYLEELNTILNALLVTSTDLTHPLIEQRPVKKIGIVIVAGDRGLCGSYNNNVFSAAKKFLKPYVSDDALLFLVGQKTINHFSNKRWPITDRIVEWGNKITFDQIKAFTDQLIHSFLNQLFDEVWLVYTHFETIMKQTVKVEKLLPIKIPEPDLNRPRFDYIFEPNEQEIFNEILGRYCLSKVQSVLNEALTSEFAARIVAMRAATKNAEEMIEDLTLVRNKVRQTGITKELIEITSGANHLKSSF